MKDILETLQILSDSKSPVLLYAVMVGIIYFGFIYWKNYLSEKAILENKKLELELIKLSFEIEKLRQDSTSSEIVLPKDYILQDVRKFLDNFEKNAFKSALESFAHHPIKAIVALSSQRFNWLTCFFVGALGAALFPIVYSAYIIVSKEQNRDAFFFKVMFYTLLIVILFTAMIGGTFGVLSKTNKTSSFIVGIVSGVPLFFLVMGFLSLVLKIWLVIENTH
jgi:hypothetical protein